MLKDEIEKILNQEMTRAQFLKSIGLGLLTIVGIPAIIHLLSPKPGVMQKNESGGSGYGNGAYGY